MRIMMLTNVYLPQVGGITRSIQAFTSQFRERGHDVLIVAPEAEDEPDSEVEEEVVRFPAIAKAYQDRYSLPLPVPGFLYSTFESYRPDIVHSHHPFLIGQAARRNAALWNVPLVYTHHTRYDVYLQAQWGLPRGMIDVLAQLWTNYCMLCDAVIAPSNSVAKLLRERGVEKRIEVIPTGVDYDFFASGDGGKIRQEVGIPADAFVVGHVGRLAPEKNCKFLADGVMAFLRKAPEAHFLLAGSGASTEEVVDAFENSDVSDRFHHLGMLPKAEVVNVYHACDVFAFASLSETQGMVLTEAMAAGNPVVALVAPGVNDVVEDEVNGRLIETTSDVQKFVEGLEWVYGRSAAERQSLTEQARETARRFSIGNCADRVLRLYEEAISGFSSKRAYLSSALTAVQRIVEDELEALSHALEALGQPFLHPSDRMRK